MRYRSMTIATWENAILYAELMVDQHIAGFGVMAHCSSFTIRQQPLGGRSRIHFLLQGYLQ
jgi:hypothetical protein